MALFHPLTRTRGSVLGPVVKLLQGSIRPFALEPSDILKAAQYFDAFGDCKVLLLGDASHGTSEFYSMRASLTKYMVSNHGFNIVAIEGDWPDAEIIDRYIRRRPAPRHRADTERPKAPGPRRDPAFMRFPTWMWRNAEVQEFVEWLRNHNDGTAIKDAVGFYGLDLYSLQTSITAVIDYLEHVDQDMANIARKRYERLLVWAKEPHKYGLAALSSRFEDCEKEVLDMLRDMLKKRIQYSAVNWDGDEFHSGEQNARVVADAENYYKAMYYSRDESWNLRDTHMFETLNRLLKHRGTMSKAIVWAHNSHVGDARASGMVLRGEFNLGQLCKESFGRNALSIGYSTYAGTVAAARHWGGDMEVMQVMPGLPNSYEELMHATGIQNFAVDLRKGICDEQLRRELLRRRLERFIGVIYRPDTERQSHYDSTILPEQFDGFVWLDRTRAVTRMAVQEERGPVEYDETWPFGV